MSEPKGTICAICENSIWCDTWGNYKCLEYKMRKEIEVISCPKFKKRQKDFKEKPCQCDDCLREARDDKE